MTAKGYLRGHEMYAINNEWFYVDNNQPTVNSPRSCGHCKKPDRKDGHDACLGKLLGVMNACCGHGQSSESYIQFENGIIIRGFTEVDERIEESESTKNKIKVTLEFELEIHSPNMKERELQFRAEEVEKELCNLIYVYVKGHTRFKLSDGINVTDKIVK